MRNDEQAGRPRAQASAWAHPGTDRSFGRPRALAMAGDLIDHPCGTAKAPTGRRHGGQMPQVVLCFRHTSPTEKYTQRK